MASVILPNRLPESDTLSVRALVTRYALIILAIAALIIIGRVISFAASTELEGVNELINIAGRQRMLSQRLTKEAYELYLYGDSLEAQTDHLQHLNESLTRWATVQPSLQAGVLDLPFTDAYIAQIRNGFADAEPHFQAMLGALTCIQAIRTDTPSSCISPIESYLVVLEDEADLFVTRMDTIVNSYSEAADVAENNLRITELGIAGIILLLLGVVSLFIFQPAVRQIRTTFKALKETQAALTVANASLEARVQERTLALERSNTALQSTNEELVSFTSIVTHDLRSPIAGIKGFLKEVQTDFEAIKPTFQAGQRTQPDADAQESFESYIPEALGSMQDAVGKAERLLGGLVEIARSRNRDYKLQPLDTQHAIESVLSSAAYDIKQLKADITVSPDFPPVQADPLAFEQIMFNLVSNALKFQHQPRPCKVLISWAKKDEQIVISVKDNGMGIPDDEQTRVFQLFRRGSNADTVEGIGMGLYYVRNLVRRNGGEIWFTSKTNEGTTFSFTLSPAAGAPTVTEVKEEIHESVPELV